MAMILTRKHFVLTFDRLIPQCEGGGFLISFFLMICRSLPLFVVRLSRGKCRFVSQPYTSLSEIFYYYYYHASNKRAVIVMVE